MASVFKHPLLRNPQRYLKGNKFHSCDLYQGGFYDSSSLNSNVIAKGLSCTKSNGLKFRFPIGGMIRLIVDEIEKDSYLIPFLKKKESTGGLFPSNYIINNEKFVDFIIKSKQYRRFIPQKFRFKNEPSIVNKVLLYPTFKGTISQVYLSKVKELLQNVAESKTNEDGILFTKEGELLKVENSKIIINIAAVDNSISLDKPIFAPFQKNEELCHYAIALVNYTGK